MLKDTTYQVYCSYLRKYRKNARDTKGFADNKYWEDQALHMEAKILAGGRPLPVEKEETPVIIPNGPEVTPTAPKVELSRDVKGYLRGYQGALAAGDLIAANRLKEKLLELGYEVKDEGTEPGSNGNNNAA